MDGNMILVVLLIVVVLYAACRTTGEPEPYTSVVYADNEADCRNRCFGDPSCQTSYNYGTRQCTVYDNDLSSSYSYPASTWWNYTLPTRWTNPYYSRWGRHYHNGGWRYGRWGHGGRWYGRRR